MSVVEALTSGSLWEALVKADPIYLDGFATMPLAREARAALLDALDRPGNAASPHAEGERAARLVEDARLEVAALIGAAPSEIVFTSGATEANNLAILGLAAASKDGSRRRIVLSAVEHKSVLEPAAQLRASGFEIVLAGVDRAGRLDLALLKTLVDEKTLLVSVMAANNETGVLQPISEAVAIAHRVGALIHCDAAQAVGKIPLDVVELDIDYLSLSGHKLYGPMGVGALYLSATAPRPRPVQFGGGQERGLRPGTLPVPLIAGLGAAARVARRALDDDARRGKEMAVRLAAELAARQLRFSPITGGHAVVPGSLVVSIDGADAETLCMMLAGSVALSTGSACTSGQLRMSHVLEAMGYSEAEASSVVRLFCHRYIGVDEIEIAADEIASVVRESRLATGGLRQ
jgi:cysteine desulfurase